MNHTVVATVAVLVLILSPGCDGATKTKSLPPVVSRTVPLPTDPSLYKLHDTLRAQGHRDADDASTASVSRVILGAVYACFAPNAATKPAALHRMAAIAMACAADNTRTFEADGFPSPFSAVPILTVSKDKTAVPPPPRGVIVQDTLPPVNEDLESALAKAAGYALATGVTVMLVFAGTAAAALTLRLDKTAQSSVAAAAVTDEPVGTLSPRKQRKLRRKTARQVASAQQGSKRLSTATAVAAALVTVVVSVYGPTVAELSFFSLWSMGSSTLQRFSAVLGAALGASGGVPVLFVVAASRWVPPDDFERVAAASLATEGTPRAMVAAADDDGSPAFLVDAVVDSIVPSPSAAISAFLHGLVSDVAQPWLRVHRVALVVDVGCALVVGAASGAARGAPTESGCTTGVLAVVAAATTLLMYVVTMRPYTTTVVPRLASVALAVTQLAGALIVAAAILTSTTSAGMELVRVILFVLEVFSVLVAMAIVAETVLRWHQVRQQVRRRGLDDTLVLDPETGDSMTIAAVLQRAEDRELQRREAEAECQTCRATAIAGLHASGGTNSSMAAVLAGGSIDRVKVHCTCGTNASAPSAHGVDWAAVNPCRGGAAAPSRAGPVTESTADDDATPPPIPPMLAMWHVQRQMQLDAQRNSNRRITSRGTTSPPHRGQSHPGDFL